MTFTIEHKCKDNMQRRAHIAQTTKSLPLITLAAFFVLLSAPSYASTSATSDNDVPSESVRIGDLDLQTPTGRHRAETRLKSAAERVCAGQFTHFAAHRCRLESVERAERTLEHKFGGQPHDVAKTGAGAASARFKPMTSDRIALTDPPARHSS